MRHSLEAVLALFAAVCCGITAAAAQSTPPPPPDARGGPPAHHAPPPEAFTACEGKSANAQCSVQLPDRTITGTCASDAQKSLFCRPDRPPPPPPDGR